MFWSFHGKIQDNRRQAGELVVLREQNEAGLVAFKAAFMTLDVVQETPALNKDTFSVINTE